MGYTDNLVVDWLKFGRLPINYNKGEAPASFVKNHPTAEAYPYDSEPKNERQLYKTRTVQQ